MHRKLIGGILGIFVLFLVINPSFNELFRPPQLKRSPRSSNSNYQLFEKSSKATQTKTISNQNNGIRDSPYEFMLPQNPNIRPPRVSIKSSAPSSIKSIVTTGNINIAVLLICFANLSFSSTHDPAYYTNLIFNHSNPKSVASYYWENSYGQLNITGEIVGGTWYRSSHSSGYWGGDSLPTSVFPQVDDKNDYIYNLVVEGAQLADPNVNFTKFDRDRDSVIDFFLVVHAGNAQEASGVSSDIWSHRWSVQTSCIVDNVVVKDYTMCGETSPVGTFAHELGHAIGDLPDLYDTDYSSDGIGRWGLMGSGAWNYNETVGSGENPGDTPAHFCAWSKIKMGWLNPKIISAHQSGIILPAIETTNKNCVLKFYLSNKSHSVTLHEYFLVCFRNQTGFDSALPGSGILIWHIDECNKYEGNDGERRKLVDLEEADADADPNGAWEQLDYVNQTMPPWASLPDDDGSYTDPWTLGRQFFYQSIPDSDSNDGMWTNVSITVNTTIENKIDVLIAYDPFPWDYTLLLMDKTALNIKDDEPSIIEHGCSSFSLAWQSNRTTGDWNIYGSQTKDAGKTWDTEVLIANSTYEDYSPSLIYWYPPTYWVRTFTPSKENKPISPGSINTQPPLHYILAFVSNRTGNPDIFITISPDFITWSTPVQITTNAAHDIDPCLLRTPSGDLGLFWASNRTGNFEIYFIEEPWTLSNIVQITNNAVLDRGPSYCYSENNTHLLAFEQKIGPNSSIQLLSSTNLTSWPSTSITCTDLSINSTEPSLIEREDRTLLIAFTHPFGSEEEIHEVISSNWTDWSPHLIMGFPKNTSSPSLVEAKCGALFMAYASYNVTQISHVYLIHTTLCYRYGVGIKYPEDTGDSFFNPSRVEQGSAYVFTGEMQLNESDFTVPADNVTVVITDTKNTWRESDDEIIFDIQLNQSHYPQFLPILDPVIGFGSFNIPLEEFQVLFGELPTCTILHFRIEWWYKDFNEHSKNINGSLFIELLVPQDHIQFEGNIPIPTTVDTPLVIQAPFIQGFVSYGVESVTLSLYDTQDIPPEPESPLHSQQMVRKVDSVLNTALTPYSQQTFIFTELVKLKGVWTIYLPWLRDNTTTKIVATSNGIYPRSSSELYVDKLPWDNNAPQLINLGPTQADDFPIVFSVQITDTQGSFNYGVDESTITFSYKIIDSEESWKSVGYDNDLNWVKIGNIYNYTLTLSGLDKPVYILYYWSASDLAAPSNIANDGNQENPYCIGISSKETKTTIINNNITIFIEPSRTTSCSETNVPPTSSTSKPGRAIGFEYMIIIGTLGAILILYRRKKP
ncbi:MAG: M6 family metalloprotease domain-containing protein [Candidatus Thorarchaeota archaeon]